MKLKIYFIALFYGFSIFSLSAKSTLLPENIEQSINISDKGEEVLVNETKELHKELEAIKSRLEEIEADKQKLQNELVVYKDKEEQFIAKSNKVMKFKQILAEDPFVFKEIEDSDYNYAYQAIVLGNLDKAEEHLLVFVKKDFSGYHVSDNKEEQKKFLENVEKLKDKANYLLGQIKLINLLPLQAIPYFAQSYKSSSDATLVLLSLLKMVETFDILKKTSEVCLTLKKVYDTVSQIQAVHPEFVLNVVQQEIVDAAQEGNACGFVVKEKEPEKVVEDNSKDLLPKEEDSKVEN